MTNNKVVDPGQINLPALLRDVAKKLDLHEVKSVLLIYGDDQGITRSFRSGNLHVLHLAASSTLHEIEHEIIGLNGRIVLPH